MTSGRGVDRLPSQPYNGGAPRASNCKSQMKKFTVRAQGISPTMVYPSLEGAFEVAKAAAQNSGKDAAVIEHDRDTSRLVKKVFHLRKPPIAGV